MERYQLLKKWVAEILITKPEILEQKSAVEVYAVMYNEFCIDVQLATKEIILQYAPKSN